MGLSSKRFLYCSCYCAKAYCSYAIWVHRQGQVKDTHRRLTGDESLFCLPLDVEVSESYLLGCLESARQYRGPEGQVRKICTTQHPSELEQHAFRNTNESLATVDMPYKQSCTTYLISLAVFARAIFSNGASKIFQRA